MAKQPLILASASERRRKILATLCRDFSVVIPDVEEVFWEEKPGDSARENARRKADWCRACFPSHYIIAADTVIDFRGRLVTKPRSIDGAAAMLRLFSDAEQTVLTAVAFSGPGTDHDIRLVASQVVFKPLNESDIQRYLALVPPLDKAGAYDIDQHGDILIASYTGSRTNIMGLPAETVRDWLDTSP